jgi:hypothetical protein
MGRRGIVVGVVLGVALLAPLAGPVRAATAVSVTTAVVGTNGSDYSPYTGSALGPDLAGGRWTVRRQPPPFPTCAKMYTGSWDLRDALGNRLVGTLTEPLCPNGPVEVAQLAVTGGEGRYAGVSGSGTLTGYFHRTLAGGDPVTAMAGVVQVTVEDTGTPPPPPEPQSFSGNAVLHDPEQTEVHYTGEVTAADFNGHITIDLSPPGTSYPCPTYSQEGTFVLDDGQGNSLSGTAEAMPYENAYYQIPLQGCESRVEVGSGQKAFAFFGTSGTGRFVAPLDGSAFTSGSTRAELAGTIEFHPR